MEFNYHHKKNSNELVQKALINWKIVIWFRLLTHELCSIELYHHHCWELKGLWTEFQSQGWTFEHFRVEKSKLIHWKRVQFIPSLSPSFKRFHYLEIFKWRGRLNGKRQVQKAWNFVPTWIHSTDWLNESTPSLESKCQLNIELIGSIKSCLIHCIRLFRWNPSSISMKITHKRQITDG